MLALVVVKALAQSPWGVFSIAMTIPIALFMGCYLRFLRPGRVTEVSLIGFALLLLAVASGDWVGRNILGRILVHPVRRSRLSWCIIIYGFAASVLPVWLLLAPRDYLSTFMKVGTIALLAIGILHRAPGHAGARRSRRSPPAATGRCSPARCSRSCSSPSRAARCPASTR